MEVVDLEQAAVLGADGVRGLGGDVADAGDVDDRLQDDATLLFGPVAQPRAGALDAELPTGVTREPLATPE